MSISPTQNLSEIERAKEEADTIESKEAIQEYPACKCSILPQSILLKLKAYGEEKKNKHYESILELAEKTKSISNHCLWPCENKSSNNNISNNNSEENKNSFFFGITEIKVNKTMAKRHSLDPALTVSYIHSFSIVDQQPKPLPKICVFDAKGSEVYCDGSHYRVFSSHNPEFNGSDSESVREAVTALKGGMRLLWEVFKTNSADGRGTSIQAIVNFGNSFFNACFDGVRIIFGNLTLNPKLKKYFGNFATDIDIVVHEFLHARIKLLPKGQSGAICEHLCDVFGAMAKQYSLTQKSHKANWKVGENIIKEVKGRRYALRDMLNPGQAYLSHPILGNDTQRPTFENYKSECEMNIEDIHHFSGPLNRVFARLACELRGYSWEIAGQIWFYSYYKLKREATFIDFAQATLEVAQERFKNDSGIAILLKKLWEESAVFTTLEETGKEAVDS